MVEGEMRIGLAKDIHGEGMREIAKDPDKMIAAILMEEEAFKDKEGLKEVVEMHENLLRALEEMKRAIMEDPQNLRGAKMLLTELYDLYANFDTQRSLVEDVEPPSLRIGRGPLERQIAKARYIIDDWVNRKERT